MIYISVRCCMKCVKRGQKTCSGRFIHEIINKYNYEFIIYLIHFLLNLIITKLYNYLIIININILTL